MKIALVKEGFELSNAESDVNDKVRAAARRFEQLGAVVSEVSIPMHQAGSAIWVPIGVEG
jgi:amidase